ncbi:ribosome biogenesis GTPase Der [Abyssibacter sp.]|jgi:GTP-binding protein|uniref:ribosome biogenesis GTPase Der n=1 Tax=Abyssibacter sp. TaxID=2320200 RepID=UPI0025B92B19|nr:ribosome biogenesis GTPase Der [Abyssibacter sp.]MCK5857803.1 ribosome biogenesis GTPase Der [Abyssibacter sp.]
MTDTPAESGALPVVALIGRPNVGKSTLFNQLTGTRDALVADLPGLTRDRQYGIGRLEHQRFIVVDTGGIGPDQDPDFREMTEAQATAALEEADVVVFLVDARSGLNPADQEIARRLRRQDRPVVLAVNKSEGLSAVEANADFYALGMGDPLPIAAAHNRGLVSLGERLAEHLPAFGQGEPPPPRDPGIPRICVIGRPNVGKSTLVNRLLGEERVVAADAPGATRDSVEVGFDWQGRTFRLVDTAGLRRRSKRDGIAEKFSGVKTLQAIEQSDVAIVVVDARSDIGAQDARVLGLAAAEGRSIIVAINKWDKLEEAVRKQIREELDYKLPYLDFAPVHTISALRGSGLGELMRSVVRASDSANANLTTSALTKVLEDAVRAHQPPAVHGRRIKLRYAHQGGRRPPKIVIHGNQTARVNTDYKRYLSNRFREAFDLYATPVEILFKSGDNPFEGRRNTLTPRQERKRKRQVKRFGKNK